VCRTHTATVAKSAQVLPARPKLIHLRFRQAVCAHKVHAFLAHYARALARFAEVCEHNREFKVIFHRGNKPGSTALVFASKDKYVAVEYGIESVYDATLNRVNRGHDFTSAQHAVTITRERGIDVGAHFILGLPGESRADIVRAIATINTLGISSIKFHQLQIYRNTPIEREFRAHPEDFLFGSDYATEQYVSLMVDILRNLDPAIAVERFVSQAPHNLISHSPFGGIRPDKVVAMVVDKMLTLGAVQGDMAQK
jgi:radical SAM superfamily enzyme